MTWNWNPDPNFSYDYDTSFSTDHDFDTVVDFDSTLDVDVDINVDVDIDGNSAVFNIDVQALGSNGATELNLTVVTAVDYSSIVATGYSAVD